MISHRKWHEGDLSARTQIQSLRMMGPLHIKDAEDRAALAEREVLERVSRAKVENSMALAFGREDAKGIAHWIALLENEFAGERRA
jgi:hypothetical protein